MRLASLLARYRMWMTVMVFVATLVATASSMCEAQYTSCVHHGPCGGYGCGCFWCGSIGNASLCLSCRGGTVSCTSCNNPGLKNAHNCSCGLRCEAGGSPMVELCDCGGKKCGSIVGGSDTTPGTYVGCSVCPNDAGTHPCGGKKCGWCKRVAPTKKH